MFRRILLVFLAVLLLVSNSAPAWAQVTYKICPDPGVCFASKEAKDKWAKERNCRFLEDVCDKAPVKDDNKGPQGDDSSLWGKLWGGIKSGLTYGYEFLKGLYSGFKDQLAGLLELVTNVDDVVVGLIKLGKAFYDNPKETLATLAQVLGQDAIDTITRATACGPYDLGKVIGQNISPVVAVKLATRIGKYGDKLADAVRVTKMEIGCASFAAGTEVLTPSGNVPIERVAVGQQVLSRSDSRFVDGPQVVSNVFQRVAPRYHEIATDGASYRVTEEHPFWVQGKGWTPVKSVSAGDVLASARGDVAVLQNIAIERPLKVYNFSVAGTPSYFAGDAGIWAHNAKCSVWTGDPKVRGRLIEDYLTHTEYKDWGRTDTFINPKTGLPFKSRNFPLVDFQKGTTVVSLKTIDTKGSTWRDRMKEHIEDLESADITVGGLKATKALDIRVQPGGLADAHFLIAYGRSRGIAVTVKELDL